jgi:hypothetical protein
MTIRLPPVLRKGAQVMNGESAPSKAARPLDKQPEKKGIRFYAGKRRLRVRKVSAHLLLPAV